MSADGEDDRARARREATPDELRTSAHDLFGAQADGRFAQLRPGQSLVAAIPIDAGSELAVVWSPHAVPSKSAAFMGIYRCGPDGERIAAGGSLRVNAPALPVFAAAIAELMDRAAEQTRADRSGRAGQPRSGDAFDGERREPGPPRAGRDR